MVATPTLESESQAPPPGLEGIARDDPLLECLSILTRLHGRPVSTRALASGLPLEDDRLTPALFVRAAEREDFTARVVRRSLGRISRLLLPAVLIMRDGDACVLVKLVGRREAEVIFPASGGGAATVTLRDLEERYSGYCIFAHPAPRADSRLGGRCRGPPSGRSRL